MVAPRVVFVTSFYVYHAYVTPSYIYIYIYIYISHFSTLSFLDFSWTFCNRSILSTYIFRGRTRTYVLCYRHVFYVHTILRPAGLALTLSSYRYNTAREIISLFLDSVSHIIQWPSSKNRCSSPESSPFSSTLVRSCSAENCPHPRRFDTSSRLEDEQSSNCASRSFPLERMTRVSCSRLDYQVRPPISATLSIGTYSSSLGTLGNTLSLSEREKPPRI